MKYGPCAVLLILLLLTGPRNTTAGSGQITEKDFGQGRTIVFAESSEIRSTISAKVVRNDEEPFSQDGEGAVAITAETFRNYIEAEREAAGPHLRKLLARFEGESIPDLELNAALQKDLNRQQALRKALELEHRKSGLKWNPETESVVHFYSGTARMRIIEVFQGQLKVGDAITVSWNQIPFRWSCPPPLALPR